MIDNKVYKLIGEAYEITEDPTVYTTEEKARLAIRAYEDFLGITTEEALDCGEVSIEVWTIV